MADDHQRVENENDVLVAESESLRGEVGREYSSPEKHLSTDHLLENLKGRTVSGAFIMLVGQGAQFVLSFGSVMVLARLLTPADFGLYAMVTAVIGYLRVFKDAGLSTATVQREGITHAQVSNLFWINVGLSGLITLLLAAGAPLVAWFYRDPRLVGVTVTLSATFLLNGLAIQHGALLSRQMRFQALAIIQVSSSLIGVSLAIGMAVAGYNYWALVVSNLITVFAMTLFTWIAIPWRPQAPTRGTGTSALVGFGANLAAGGLIYALARGTDNILIGRYYGAAPLGLYSRAAAMLTRPMEQFLSPLESVFLPGLSRVQEQPERYRRAFLRIYESLALVSCLFTGLLFALARPITLVVLGPKWEAAAIMFAAFTAATFFSPPITASTWLFASQGRGREWLVASSILSVITVTAFLVGLPFGPVGVAISAAAFGVVTGLPMLYYMAGRRGPVSSGDLWRGVLQFVPLWAVVCGSTYLMRGVFPQAAPLLQLAICAPVGLMAGVILIAVVPSMRRVGLELVEILRQFRPGKDASV